MSKEQPSLPLDLGFQQGRHDYGGQYDDGDFGHEYPFVQPIAQEVDGVSVSLKEREETLRKIAKLYALKARADGLEKAINDRTERAKLRERYKHDLGIVVGRTVKKAEYTMADEQAILNPLLKTDELQKAGFEEADVDEAALTTTVGIRQDFGISVGDSTRQKNLRVAAASAKNARTK